MSSKIKVISFVSKDRLNLLKRVVSSFREVIKEEKLEFSLYVSGTGLSVKNPEITDLSSIDKHKLCDNLIAKTIHLNVPPKIIEFALFEDPKMEVLSMIDTGTNRNALMLQLIDQVFLSVDDDILCQLTSTKKSVNNKVIFDNKLQTIKFFTFLNQEDCLKAIDYSKKGMLQRFVSAHEELLNYENPAFATSRVAATLSGHHGDSGYDSPKGLLNFPFYQPEPYKAAIKNRLMLTYVERSMISNNSQFMTMCCGLNNKLLLPPFFPLGRNQDGVFGACLKACLPNVGIGYVPWVIRHDPIPTREYADGEVQIWRFRISDLIILLLETFSKTNLIKSTASDYERYDLVGEYLENFAKQEPDKFISSLRKLYVPKIDDYADYLRKLTISHRAATMAWRSDALACVMNLKLAQKKDTFCIPEELLQIEDVNKAIEISRGLVLRYGTLLRHWKTIREVAKSC